MSKFILRSVPFFENAPPLHSDRSDIDENINVDSMAIHCVLMVEDDEGHAALLKDAVQNAFEGVTVRITRTGAGCISALATNSFDCVLLDQGLPDTDGVSLLCRIREKGPHLPVVMVTGCGSEAVAVEAMKCGATDYIAKTVDLSYLDLLPNVIKKSVEMMRAEAERTALRRALSESESRYRDLIESSPEMIHQIDSDRRFLHVNRTELQKLGYSLHEMIHMQLEDIIPEDDIERVLSDFEQMKRSGTSEIETAFVAKDGHLVYVEATATAVRDASGDFMQARTFARDVTNKKQLEEQLFQSQKMESVGTLAAGVAHDFNNILATVLLAAQMIRMKASKNAVLQKHAESIQSCAESGGELASQLLSFARSGHCDTKSVQPNNLIRDVMSLLKPSIDKSIDLRFEFDPDIKCILADRNQIAQVLLNISLNAMDAMDDGGTLTFRTSDVEIDHDKAIEKKIPAGKYVQLSIRDTGTGIEESLLTKIFDPFFTTKEVNKGTGLGLSVAQGIVKKHEGAIEVHSAVGKGTRFDIYIKAVDDPEEIKKDDTDVCNCSGSESILVVDDKDNVRDSVSQMLTLIGYQISVASDGCSAIQIYQSKMQEIDLVLLDLHMPGLNGLATFERLREIDPSVKVILTSGYERDKAVAVATQQGIAGFIKKPYKMERLHELLREILDEPAPDEAPSE